MIQAWTSGFFLGLSLIVAIGAQNAFVLRQGLIDRHVLAICLACALSDALLICLGVVAFQTFNAIMPGIETLMRLAGAVFLLAYGAVSLRAAFRSSAALFAAAGASGHLAGALSTCLALTWLNPHVYLDTVILLGSLSVPFADHAVFFATGAMTASFLFFFSLGYGARLLQPLFANPLAWRVLEVMTGLVMWYIAARLLLDVQ